MLNSTPKLAIVVKMLLNVLLQKKIVKKKSVVFCVWPGGKIGSVAFNTVLSSSNLLKGKKMQI